jgi:hypothetical protein
MKKLLLFLFSTVIFMTHSSAMEKSTLQQQTLTPQQLRDEIELKANTFAHQRANPPLSKKFWRQAYIAYVFDTIIKKKGSMRFDEIRAIGSEFTPIHKWRDMPLPHTMRAWNDEPLIPHFKRALLDRATQEELIEQDWKKICESLYPMSDKK